MLSILTLSLAVMAAAGQGIHSVDDRKGCEKIKGAPLDLSQRKVTEGDGIEMPVKVHNVDPEVPKELLDKACAASPPSKSCSRSGCVEDVTIVKSSSQKPFDDAGGRGRETVALHADETAGRPIPAFVVAVASFGPSTP